VRQAGRSLQIESAGAAVLLAGHALASYHPRVVFGDGSWNLAGGVADALGVVLTLLQLAAIAVVGVLYARGPRTRERLALGAAAAVAAWVTFGKVLSPQYLLWLVPLVPLVPSVAAWALFLAALALTHVEFPSHFKELTHGGAVAWLVLARNLLLVGLYAVLILRTSTARSTSTSRFRATRIQTAPPPA
jgi:hypothetical protein